MREILFKAIRIDNGEWVEGNLINTIDEPDKWEIQLFERPNYSVSYPVVTTTICQYTGLRDKNGERIFENDIIFNAGRANKKHASAVVEFSACAWRARCLCGELFEHVLDNANMCEVTGNIHDEGCNG